MVVGGEQLAAVYRNGIIESIHAGHVRVANAGDDVVLVRGGDIEFYPRSSVKPFQALAALRAGAELTDEQLALACASHAGTPAHVEVVDATLQSVVLNRTALRNTPDKPLDPESAAAACRDGVGNQPVLQNCSGKHAGMLAACVHAGWDTANYLNPSHPLQQLILETFAELTGHTSSNVGVDGCGAPTPTTTLSGLARAARTLVTAEVGTNERRIAQVMRSHPHLVSGYGRFDTLAMQNVPGLMVKGGAEGVLMAALFDGSTIITKIADGNHRANTPVFVAALGALEVEADLSWARERVLGHGEEVGTVEWIEAAKEEMKR